MSRRLVDHVAPPVYGAIDFAVVVMPALAVKVAADRGGMGDTDGLDLLVVSIAIGAVHAAVAAARLWSEERVAVRRMDTWIAAADALVVLTLTASVLPVTVLWRFADEHASIADRGYPVAALWAGVQIVAVILAELTGRVVFWWLEPHPRRGTLLRRRSSRDDRRASRPSTRGTENPDRPIPQAALRAARRPEAPQEPPRAEAARGRSDPSHR